MNICKIVQFMCFALVLSPIGFPAVADENRWWPVQATPKAIVRVRENEFPAPAASCAMMAQSLAGLAAKAVTEARADEMVWVACDNIDIEDWFARLLRRQPQPELRGNFPLWNLVDRYSKRGIIKGYILYRSDHSKG